MINFAEATIPMFEKALVRGAVKREPVCTYSRYRGLGKTTALINFAKEHFLTVIVPSEVQVKSFIETHGYTKIVSANHIYYHGHKLGERYVYDEKVNISSLHIPADKVVTGYEYQGGF